MKIKATLHEHWLMGRISNFGGFQTKLFIAYSEADSGNKARLQGAFPEWFKEEFDMEEPVRPVASHAITPAIMYKVSAMDAEVDQYTSDRDEAYRHFDKFKEDYGTGIRLYSGQPSDDDTDSIEWDIEDYYDEDDDDEDTAPRPYPEGTICYQPEYDDNGRVVGHEDDNDPPPSFHVWLNKDNLLKEWPNCTPKEYDLDGIEEPTIVDEQDKEGCPGKAFY